MAAGRVLIVYGSWAGSTAQIAETLADELNRNGCSAAAVPADTAPNLSGYSAVVIGTGIRSGLAHPDMVKFLSANEQDLTKVPCAAFAVCMAMRHGEKVWPAVDAYIGTTMEAAPSVQIAATGRFGGIMDFSKLTEEEADGLKKHNIQEGNFRDVESESAWARSLLSLLDR